MKNIPGWAKTVGIIMIIVGAFGVFNQTYYLAIPTIVDFQRSVMQNVSQFGEDMMELDSFDLDSLAQDSISMDSLMTVKENLEKGKKAMQDMHGMMDNFLYLSPEFKRNLKLLSIIGIFLNVLYIFSGIFYLGKKPFALKFSIAILSVCLIVGVSRMILLGGAGDSMVASMLSIGGIFGLVADAVLLMVIIISDKSFYTGKELESSPEEHIV